MTLKKNFEDFFRIFDGPPGLEIRDLTITTGDKYLAFSHSIQRVTGRGKDGSRIDQTARVTDVYKKIGGRWLIVHEHVSVPETSNPAKNPGPNKP